MNSDVAGSLHNSRRLELQANLSDVNARIAAAAVVAGRSPSDITLVAVTKTHPASDISLLAELGITHVGESRVQEAAAKFSELALAHKQHADSVPNGASPSGSLKWHLIGQLQRNKVNAALSWADVVESVDREVLVEPLARAAAASGVVLDVLVQFDLASEQAPGRGGVWPASAPSLIAAIASQAHLRLAGVMAVAPLGLDSALAFARLADLHESMLTDFPDAVIRSAGMSGDLEQAISAGATHVRIGTALLGSRPPVRYGA